MYFDGYLPAAKLPVRMGRAAKITSQLNQFHTNNPQGGYASDLCSPADTPLNPFELRRPPNKPLLPPAFLVPAVIEALGQSNRYRHVVRLVPGEADAYCAQHLAEQGGLVLTSDSDLLVHDLGHGRVSFLRSVYQDASARLACSIFCPSGIAKTLGLGSSGGMCRFAYERIRSPQASLAQLQQACSDPLSDEREYRDFCQQYMEHERCALPLSVGGNSVSLDGLDPRISELVLQLGHPRPEHEAKIFLPHLLESPARGSAWEQSLATRQLAYTIAQWIIPGTSSPIQEYRRVQSLDQRGRLVNVTPWEAALESMQVLLHMMVRLKDLTRGKEQLYWTMLSLLLDIRACEEQEKQSHVLRTVQGSSPPISPRVAWDHIHFLAQLQAGLYSLRILKQILSLVPQDQTNLISPTFHQLRESLSDLPPLLQYPDVDIALQFLRRADHFAVMSIFKEFLHKPEARVHRLIESSKVEKKKSKKRKKQSNKGGKKGATSANMFDLLSTG